VLIDERNVAADSRKRKRTLAMYGTRWELFREIASVRIDRVEHLQTPIHKTKPASGAV
jgi:hypothetical protein